MDIQRPVVFYSALVAAGICIVLMWRLSRSVPRPVASASTGAAPSMGDDLLLKFVVDSAGARKGETVAVDGDRLILKTPDGFASVPAVRLLPTGADLKIEGEVDWEEARKAGEEWRARSYKEITYAPHEVPKEPA